MNSLIIVLLRHEPCSEDKKLLSSIVQHTPGKIGIILIQNGVTWGLTTHLEPFKDKIQIYGLNKDIQARGISEKVSIRVQGIEYEEMVDLVMEGDNQIVSLS